MSFFYSTFGVRIQSNTEISGLSPIRTSPSPSVDIDLSLGQIPFEISDRFTAESELIFRTPQKDAQEKLWVHKAGGYYRLRYHDDTTFVIDSKGTNIWASWVKPLTLEDTVTYLLGPILGFALLLRGTHCLHASAISIDDQAVAIVGPSCAGKSTMAAAFAKRGYAVLTDDVLPLIGDGSSHFYVQPAYPRIRLWGDSVEYLFGRDEELPLLTPNWDKRYLDLAQGNYRFQQESIILSAIYLLAEREDMSTAPFIQDVLPPDGLMSLVGNSYVNYLLDDDARRKEFELLGNISRNIPMRRVTPHADPAHISSLCDVILEDFSQLTYPIPKAGVS